MSPLSFSNAVFQFVKPVLVKTKSLSLIPPNLRQGKQKHASSFTEYSSHGLPRYQPGQNARVVLPKCLFGKFRFVGCNGAVALKPMSKSSAVATDTLGTVMSAGGSAPAVLNYCTGAGGYCLGVVVERKQP